MKKDRTDLKIALSILILSALGGTAIIVFANQAEAAFKVEKLNDFFLTNRTTGEPMLAVVGTATNNGTNVEDYVDLSLALLDKQGNIVGTSFLYDDDVKVNDTIPFEFNVNPEEIENGDFNNVQNYTVIAE